MNKKEMIDVAVSEFARLRSIEYLQNELIDLWACYDLEDDPREREIILHSIRFDQNRLTELRGASHV